MSILTAPTLYCGSNAYQTMTEKNLYDHLKTNPVCFEVLKNCNVKPYYDFDWEWINNDVVSKEQCTAFISKYIKSTYKHRGIKVEYKNMKIAHRWIDGKTGGTKLSLHFILNDAGTYHSGLDFYNFKDEKEHFIATFEKLYACKIDEVFKVGDYLFDQSVYKARECQQKFGLVLSRKVYDGEAFEPINRKGQPADISEDYSEYFITDNRPVEVTGPVTKATQNIEKIPQKNLRRMTMKDIKAKSLIDEYMYHNMLQPTLNDIIVMMNEIK